MPHTPRRRHALVAALLGLGMLFSVAAPARAVIMTYTLTGNVSGSLNGNFVNIPFTWTQTGDTALPTTLGVDGIPALAAITSTIQIGALPLATLTVSFFTGFYDFTDILGFTNSSATIGLTATSAALNGYDFLAIGPLNVTFFGSSGLIGTDQGFLVINSATDLIFTATEAGTSIPEPASLALLATGLLGLGLRRRRG